MKVIKHYKLVRDKIPDIILGSKKCNIRVLDTKEYRKQLFLKVHEEVKELALAKEKDDIIEEFADTYQVLEDLASELNISIGVIDEIKYKKTEERGAFKSRIFLETVVE